MKKKGIYLLHAGSVDSIYGPAEREAVAECLELVAPPQTPASIQKNPGILKEVQVIMSGWGCPRIDADFLVLAPKLEAVFYGAGSIRGVVSDAFWDRDLVITSAYAANAVPVAEYTLSQILFGLKAGWPTVRRMRETRQWDHPLRTGITGAYGATVGLISLGLVARHLCGLLRAFELNVLAYDPFVSESEATALGATLTDLDSIFTQSGMVSLHTPNLPETVGMITGDHFRKMRPNSTFINTARGAVVREPEMIEVLQQRPDLTAVLDVTFPEPPPPENPLWTLPNVVLTPHMAGSMAQECRRMGRSAVTQLELYLAGEPMPWRLTRAQAEKLA